MTSLTQYDDAAPHAERQRLSDHAAIAKVLAPHCIVLERWSPRAQVTADASDADILEAYSDDIAALTARGGYQSWDVLRVTPDHPQREELRAKFLAEHIHDDDEVRFFVEGAGLFYIHAGGMVHALECTAGDLIAVPAGTHHWFDTGAHPHFTVIRLFTTPDGWVARFTGDPIADAIPKYEGLAA